MKSPQVQLRKVHRRSRIPLSCDACRSRKLRCNRERPCQNCSARGEQASCKFREPANAVHSLPASRGCGVEIVENGAGTAVDENRMHGGAELNEAASDAATFSHDHSLRYRSDGTPPKAFSNDSISQRINHLENLVNKLVAERPPAWTPPHSIINSMNGTYTPDKSDKTGGESSGASDITLEDTFSIKTAGKTIMNGSHSVYLDGDDWSVVLQEINELKKTWHRDQDDPSDYTLPSNLSHTIDGPSLLFDQGRPLEMVEIISTMPPKHEVDRLIAIFFDRRVFPISVPPILHRPTFMREYNDYWVDPSQANPIWLGLVFSILGITMLAYHQYGEPPEYQGRSESLFQLYRTRTSQCLLRGDMTKCLPYTVETLRFNATAELNRKDDNRRGLWIMTGLVVRTAINMGYHRDPISSSGISVLQAEYRRRVWSSVISMDDMASFLGGFPRTMSGLYSDTLEPHNLHDWELSEDMVALPPSRSLAEATDVTYLIVKDRLFRQLGRVADFNSNPASSSYEMILDIDRAVHDVYNSFPSHMTALDSSDSPGGLDSPVARNLVKFSNLSLMGMVHKGVCTLHRRFLAIGRSDGQFRFSRDRCISSALELLALQQRLEPAFYRISQTRQMLMLGSMVLFLELALRRKNADEEEVIPDSSVILQALRTSCTLVADAADCCEETKKMHHFIVSTLSSFEATPPQAAEVNTMGSPPGLISSSPFNLFSSDLSFDDNWSEMDMAWTTWDNFIEESNYQPGPNY